MDIIYIYRYIYLCVLSNKETDTSDSGKGSSIEHRSF